MKYALDPYLEEVKVEYSFPVYYPAAFLTRKEQSL